MKRMYIPENLDIELLIEQYPTNHIIRFKKEKLLYILNLITEIPARSHKIRDVYYRTNGYVYLNSTKLRENGIHNYHQYLEYLVGCGVLETDNHFIVGEKSRGYRFTSKYQTPIKKTLVKYHPRVYRLRKSRYRKSNKKYNYLSKWWGEGNLTIDYEASMNYVSNDYNKSKEEKPNVLRYNMCVRIIDDLHNNDYYFVQDEKGRRIHTTLTCTPKELRRLITYQGQTLVGVDIKNAQPYFSTILLKPEFYEKETEELNIYKLTNQKKEGERKEREKKQRTKNTITLLKSLEEDEKQEVNRYITIVVNGELYEQYQSEWNKVYRNISRDQAKKKVIKALYSDHNKTWEYEKEKEVFQSLFPTIYKIFSTIKDNDYTFFAILLQRIESYIVIDKACKRIASQYPNLPLYSIHDNIVTIKGYEMAVKKIMEEELIELTGFKPRVKIKSW